MMWMGDYAHFFFDASPEMAKENLGDLSSGVSQVCLWFEVHAWDRFGKLLSRGRRGRGKKEPSNLEVPRGKVQSVQLDCRCKMRLVSCRL